MPGSYAHITLANIMNASDNKDSIQSMSNDNKLQIGQRLHFLELGAVSPDYPYLAITDSGAQKWADKMHYEHTGEMIRSGIRLLRDWTGEACDKGYVWLLGYSSHVIADVTIHPVIQMKVGEYQTHKTEHRTCEMNQDAYIYSRRLNRTGVGLTRHLESGIGLCEDPHNRSNLDSDVLKLWSAMLEDVYPDDFTSNRPDPNEWHRGFRRIIDLASDASARLVPMARHVGISIGLLYPDASQVDQQFIRNLDTPLGLMDYDAVFDIAVKNINTVWGWITEALFQNSTANLSKIADWNLDTGRDGNNQLGFWS